MATVTERIDSRQITEGRNPRATLTYLIFEESDESLALAALQAAAPTSFNSLPRQDVRINVLPGSDVLVTEIWEGEVAYYVANNQSNQPPQEGDGYFNFDTSGGTIHITQSRETISKTEDTKLMPGGATDYAKAIGASDDGVEGVDIVSGQFNWTETWYLAAADVDSAYRTTLAELTGTVNNAAFRGFNAKEVLFLGATGSRRGTGADDDWEINFSFTQSPNLTNIVISTAVGTDTNGITVAAKKGFEYIWVRYKNEVDASANVTRQIALQANVEEVYEDKSFASLGIGTDPI